MINLSILNSLIGVVMVNFRTPDLVISGLYALQNERKKFTNLNVLIVDNLSGDDSILKITGVINTNGWNHWVKLEAAPKNGGYAYGNNLGFKALMDWQKEMDYYWMLNPDTEVLPGATEAMIECLCRHPMAIAGSRLQDRDGTVQASSFNYPSLISEMCSGFGLGFLDKFFSSCIVRQPIPEEETQVGWLAGASLMFSKNVFQKLGFLDEVYFLYFEEVDYLLKAKRKGIFCRYVPSSKVVHEMGASTGISDSRKKQKRKPTYWFESRSRYFAKNHGRFYSFSADFVWVVGYISWSLRKSITDPEAMSMQPPHFLMDFIKNSYLNPSKWFKPIEKARP